MGIFNFVLDSFKGVIFDFKVDRWVLVASTVGGLEITNPPSDPPKKPTFLKITNFQEDFQYFQGVSVGF